MIDFQHLFFSMIGNPLIVGSHVDSLLKSPSSFDFIETVDDPREIYHVGNFTVFTQSLLNFIQQPMTSIFLQSSVQRLVLASHSEYQGL
jgi:hypothetical protein